MSLVEGTRMYVYERGYRETPLYCVGGELSDKG